MDQKPEDPARKQRCFTRAVKNANFLKQHDPATFARDKDARGFGTGVPIEILQVLHRLEPDSAELKPYPELSAFIARRPMPKVQGWKR